MQPNHRGPLVQQHQVPAADCGPNVVYRHYLAPPRHLMDEVRVSWHQTAFEPIDLLSHLIQDAIRGGHVSGIIICSPGTAVRLGMVCIAPALIQAFHRMLDFAYDATYPRCILCSWPWWSRGCYPHQPVVGDRSIPQSRTCADAACIASLRSVRPEPGREPGPLRRGLPVVQPPVVGGRLHRGGL
jgi:hypothetical protein